MIFQSKYFQIVLCLYVKVCLTVKPDYSFDISTQFSISKPGFVAHFQVLNGMLTKEYYDIKEKFRLLWKKEH